MCGFFAIFGTSGTGVAEDRLADLQKVLGHRGPDDFQVLTETDGQLFAWRLAIVDRDEARQPMHSGDGRSTILYNGEVYNYEWLRTTLQRRGVRFRTGSDTEVILAAYDEWGASGFDHFEGMFAVCIVDRVRRRIVLARDRLGVKPLYYAERAGMLAVASEPKALLAGLTMSPVLDREALIHYLVFQVVPGPLTLFKGIEKVPPGRIVEFSVPPCVGVGVSMIGRRAPARPALSYADAVEVTRGTVLDQARLALDTDLPLTFHLSGGFDSNLLVAIHRELYPGRKVTCVSSVIEGPRDSESAFIRHAAQHYGYPSEVVSIDAPAFLEALDEVLFYLDEPLGDPGVVAQFLVNKRCARYGKVVVSGQGLDELFFGYIRNLAAYLWMRLGPEALDGRNPRHELVPLESRAFLGGWEPYLEDMTDERGAAVTWSYFRRLCRLDPFARADGHPRPRLAGFQEVARNSYQNILRESPSVGDFMLAAETQLQLPALLQMEDRASMRWSIEARVPFCTASVLDLAHDLDLHWKLYNGLPKGVVRDAFRGVIAPAVESRREKVGRPIPLKRWLAEPAGQRCRERLRDARPLFLDLTGVDLVDWALESDNPYERMTWGLLSLSSWIRIFGVAA